MLHAVIMAGGSGTRFWPRSRRAWPKQLLPIASERSLIEDTVDRLGGLVPGERIHVVTSAIYLSQVREMLLGIPSSNVVGEPVGRDTAAAIGLAAFRLQKVDPEAAMLVLPADHVIHPVAEFERTVHAGEKRLEERPGTLLTFGIKPTYPATGYGYIKRAAGSSRTVAGDLGVVCHDIEAFKEKPDEASARRFLDDGGYYWNAGIFLWTAAGILEEIRRQLPALHGALESIDGDLFGPGESQALARVYPDLEKVSIDYGVMENARDRSVVEATFDWDDVGSWEAIEKYHPRDGAGNVSKGEVVVLDGARNLIDAGDGVVALIGVEDLIVVRTGDAVLVCRKDRSQDVKKIVGELRARGRLDLI